MNNFPVILIILFELKLHHLLAFFFISNLTNAPFFSNIPYRSAWLSPGFEFGYWLPVLFHMEKVDKRRFSLSLLDVTAP